MRRYHFVIITFLLATPSFGQLPDKEIINLKTGRTVEDTSYVYWLPYEHGKKFLLIQGSNSKLSHNKELALDFKMKKGSNICAARAGIVSDVREESEKGGLKQENLGDGNYIIVRHEDGSTAQYWHLTKDGAYVQAGEHVSKGQVIGASGNTGYTAFPHLHFQITDKAGKQNLTRFETKKGRIYLRPGRWYRSLHKDSV